MAESKAKPKKAAKPEPATPVKASGAIRVKAVALGFYDNLRRRPGAVFTIKSEKEFSNKWMVKLVSKPAPAVEVEETEDETEASGDEPESVI